MKARCTIKHPGSAIMWFALLLPGSVAHAQQGVTDTVHNLSASGPGVTRAVSSQQICIFCHATHRATAVQPLWNRADSPSNFTIYQSSTLDATPGQPTGASKFCLSCHDGTIALGSVVSRPQPIDMAGAQRIQLGRKSYLGTDLSDDHPISITYGPDLAAADAQLRYPSLLPSVIRLDHNDQLQCTACHDSHSNEHGKFLVMRNEFGALCIACHQMNGWEAAAHQASSAPTPFLLGEDWAYATVRMNACGSCHRTHGAGGHERLLRSEVEEENCLNCHDGQIAKHNIKAVLSKRFGHDVRRFTGIHDPAEATTGSQPHAECSDCHNPHAARSPILGRGYQPIGETLVKNRGVSISGVPLDEARFEYEICLRCHGDSHVPTRNRIGRHSDTSNMRLRFNMSNPSYHPVVNSVINPDVPSLKPEMRRGSMIRCTDCHNNDTTRRSGGVGPDGPHGSVHEWLLEKNYSTRDPTPESSLAYALCYKCHERASILNNESFKGHRQHVQAESTPCSVCHDPHGVSNVIGGAPGDHTHLINFDLSVVNPGSNGRLEFIDKGVLRSSCSLTCHGFDHDNLGY